MFKLAMASQFRDETRYLREWIEYHLLVGADHIFLLCNDDPEEYPAVEAVLQPYAWDGVLSWDRFPSRHPSWQLMGWRHILKEWGHLAKWMCLTDMDAFLFPVEGTSVLPVLDRFDHPEVAGLGVNTCTFGSSGLLTPPALQVESFVSRAELTAPCNWTANYILRPARLQSATVTKGYCLPLAGYDLVDTDWNSVGKGKKLRPLDVLRLNHYSVRSRADWERKVRRGWPEAAVSWTGAKGKIEEHKFAALNRNEVHDDSMKKFVPELRRRMGL